MPETIVDAGTRNAAHVDTDHRLWVNAKSSSIQHIVSEIEEEAYQVIGIATLGSGTVVVLHLTNNNPNKHITVTYLRHQVIGASGGTDFPNSSNYFSIRCGREYASGGAEVTPVNMFIGSGNTPDITVYNNNPTLTGTATEFDRWYTKADGDMNTFNKEGSLIIPPNKTIEISYVGDRTGGSIYARISFIMEAEL
jgi:hypothetical protein